jgi:polyhydroxyalkanoate synthesis regulator phasin
MNEDDNVFQRIRARGEAMFTQVSAELLENPRFAKALQHAMRGKEMLDQAAARALKTMNVPTRTEFKKAVRRIEALETEIAALKAKASPRPPARARSSRKKMP